MSNLTLRTLSPLSFDDLHVEVDYGSCVQGGDCDRKIVLGYEPRAKFFGPWKFYVPNSIWPNGNGIEDTWFMSGGGNGNGSADCLPRHPFTSQVYYADLEIWDRWGELGYKVTIWSGLYDEGVVISDLYWDGQFLGSPGPPGVYVAVITLRSCYEGNFEQECELCNSTCTDCSICPNPNSEQETIISKDITLIL